MSRGSVAVVGGSIAGLAAANVLAQRGFEVTVFERFPTGFESRGGGLGGVDRQLYESIRADGATLRQHGPGGWFYGDLWRYLRGGLPDDAVRHGVAVADVGDVAAPTVDGAAYDFVVVADGGWSSLRRFVVGDQQPVYSGYCLWRGLMDLERAPSFRSFGGHRSGYFDTGGFPISCADGRTLYNGGFYLRMPEDEVARPASGAARQVGEKKRALPDWYLPLYEKLWSHVNGGELVRLWRAMATHGKITQHAVWEFCADRVVNGRVVIIGDAAHMASPRTGAGAYTGLLDAHGLGVAFDRHGDVDAALAAYAVDGKRRANELHRASLNVKRQFVDPSRPPVPARELLAQLEAGGRQCSLN